MTDRRLIIFDWDGTLVDSVGAIVTSMQRAALAKGLPVADETAVRQIIGLELGEAIASLYPGLSARDRDALKTAYVEAYLSDDRAADDFFPGIPGMLQDLSGQGVMLAVATGKSRRGLDRSIKALGVMEVFCATICADETRGKPDPAMVFELCKRSGVDATRTPVVGDTLHDLEMARRARSPAIAVAWGAHSIEDMLYSHPVAAAYDVQQLRGHLQAV